MRARTSPAIPGWLDVVGALYGEPACLFKDKLIFKAPGTPGYALHQDYISWKSFPTTFLTAIVAIDAADAANGATEVYAGYHQEGCMTPKDGQYHQLSDEAVAPARSVVLSLEPGDVALFSGFTPHRSAPNRSLQPRRLLYLSYNALSDGGESAPAALRRVPHLAHRQVRGVRQDGHVLSLTVPRRRRSGGRRSHTTIRGATIGNTQPASGAAAR
jgi:2-aminoethylphosphonate dioxygenase